MDKCTAFRNSGSIVEVAEFIQLTMALSFLPINHVVNRFQACVDRLSNVHYMLLTHFIDYFRSTWLDGIFSLKMWNHFLCDNNHRTNNRIESWHATLKHKIPSKPNIFILIKNLQSEEALANISWDKAEIGEEPPARRRKYVLFEKSLEKTWDSFQRNELTVEHMHRRVRHYIRKFK